MTIDWKNAPKDATHYTIKESGAIWFKNINGFWTIYDSGVWYAIGLPASDLIPRPTSTAIPELKKLTQAVFDRLPIEYRWAKILENGDAVAGKKYEHKETLLRIGSDFDTTDWQNSLIERQDVLTVADIDWSKAPEGAYVRHYVAQRLIDAKQAEIDALKAQNAELLAAQEGNPCKHKFNAVLGGVLSCTHCYASFSEQKEAIVKARGES